MTDIQEELALLREERQVLADSIQNDDEIVGDSGDQAESLERMEALERLDRRIEQLVAAQEDGEREPLNPSGDRVETGTVVTVKFGDGSTETVSFVRSILEENDADPVVTPDSPLGQALTGASVGDRVSFDAPTGSTEVEVISIEVAPAS